MTFIESPVDNVINFSQGFNVSLSVHNFVKNLLWQNAEAEDQFLPFFNALSHTLEFTSRNNQGWSLLSVYVCVQFSILACIVKQYR
jgi:hypothetical protein